MDQYDEQLSSSCSYAKTSPPLAQRMLEGLEKYVKLDTPFPYRRKISKDWILVRASLSNPKVTASEQVRQILEAYNIEG